MTCKDCLHYEACKNTAYKVYDDDICCKAFAEICTNFSDKSEWVHLPCKVSTPVFFLRDKNNIIKTNVEKIIFKGKEGKGCYIKLECNTIYETSCQSIGKTVFFTKESAEKALEERSKHHE